LRDHAFEFYSIASRAVQNNLAQVGHWVLTSALNGGQHTPLSGLFLLTVHVEQGATIAFPPCEPNL
jgi:hypothetical protein